MNWLIEPNIHPVLVHFAYALSVSSAGCYLTLKLIPAGRRRDSLRPAADWMLAFSAFAILATVAAGFQAYYSVAHDGPSHEAMTTHRNWAVPSATAILVLAFWRWRTRAKSVTGLFTALLGLAALSLSVTAWWGGHIVYNYGLGVSSLPSVTGDGHDHDHGATSSEDVNALTPHDPADGHHDAELAESAIPDGHDNSDGHHDIDAESAPAKLEDGSPEAIVDAFGIALQSGDEQTLRDLSLPNIIIAESGGTERSFAEYAGHHMPADIAFTGAVHTTLKKRDVLLSANQATVITESQIHGTFKGQTVHSKMTETMVLLQQDEGWRIAHIHWSSAPISGDHEH